MISQEGSPLRIYPSRSGGAKTFLGKRMRTRRQSPKKCRKFSNACVRASGGRESLERFVIVNAARDSRRRKALGPRGSDLPRSHERLSRSGANARVGRIIAVVQSSRLRSCPSWPICSEILARVVRTEHPVSSATLPRATTSQGASPLGTAENSRKRLESLGPVCRIMGRLGAPIKTPTDRVKRTLVPGFCVGLSF